MASRLSEESVVGVLDAGHGALPMVDDWGEALIAEAAAVDLDALLLAEDPEQAVQAVPAPAIYRALVARGPEDALEILPLLSQDQVCRIFDYEAWSSDAIDPMKTWNWLKLFKEAQGPEELVRRLRDLDEELQVALLAKLVTLVEEEDFEKLSDAEQDTYQRLPCGTLYFRIKDPDPRREEMVTEILDAALGVDTAYAYGLLLHGAGLPPHEAEVQALQFRSARLEEDGFVSEAESRATCLPLAATELSALLARCGAGSLWRGFLAAPAQEASLSVAGPNGLFLRRVLQLAEHDPRPESRWTAEQVDGLRRGFAFLANALCGIAQVEPDDVRGARRVLERTQALASLGLEALAAGNLDIGRRLLAAEHPKTLFRLGVTLVREVALATLNRAVTFGLPDAERIRDRFAHDRRGLALRAMDLRWLPVLGLWRTEMLKGLCNRFPARPVRVRPADGGGERILFSPITSLAELRDLTLQLDAMLGLLRLGQLGGAPSGEGLMLDEWLAAALNQALAGGPFAVTTAQPTEVAPLLGAAAATRLEELLAGVRGSLELDLAADGGESSPSLTRAGRSWSIGRSLAWPEWDPVTPTVAELAAMGRAALAGSGVTVPPYFYHHSDAARSAREERGNHDSHV